VLNSTASYNQAINAAARTLSDVLTAEYGPRMSTTEQSTATRNRNRGIAEYQLMGAFLDCRFKELSHLTDQQLDDVAKLTGDHAIELENQSMQPADVPTPVDAPTPADPVTVEPAVTEGMFADLGRRRRSSTTTHANRWLLLFILYF
jgi:hypothetical protein